MKLFGIRVQKCGLKLGEALVSKVQQYFIRSVNKIEDVHGGQPAVDCTHIDRPFPRGTRFQENGAHQPIYLTYQHVCWQ